MDKKFINVLISLGVVLVLFGVVMFVLGAKEPAENAVLNFSVDQASVGPRFLFVVLGIAIALGVYFSTQENKAWEVGTRQMVWMAIGTALYAIFSWLFNGTVFDIPSASQVSLRPAIAIPIFFGFAFGPIVGFFTGAVGNMFGDVLTGFGLSPQWSIGNGLVGFISGMWMLFSDRKKSMDTAFYISGALAAVTALLFFINPDQANLLFFDVDQGVFGDAKISPLAGIAILIGFALVFAVRYFFKNEDVVTAMTWGMLGNIVGLLFASLSDMVINGFSLPATIVGQFLPAAGPNLIFAAILVPMLVVAYSTQTQSGGITS